jgi:hypothetical protein
MNQQVPVIIGLKNLPVDSGACHYIILQPVDFTAILGKPGGGGLRFNFNFIPDPFSENPRKIQKTGSKKSETK